MCNDSVISRTNFGGLPVLMILFITFASWPLSREFNSLTSSKRLTQRTNKEQTSRMRPMAKSDREESANRCLPDRETETWDLKLYTVTRCRDIF